VVTRASQLAKTDLQKVIAFGTGSRFIIRWSAPRQARYHAWVL